MTGLRQSRSWSSGTPLVTLAVIQALLGFTSESRWLRHAHQHLGHLFRHLPGQSGYNKRLRRAAALITTVRVACAAPAGPSTAPIRHRLRDAGSV